MATRIVIIAKLPASATPQPPKYLDLSNATSINELFDRLENIDMPPRLKPAEVEAADPRAAKAEKAHAQKAGATTAESAGLQIFEHVVQKSGKVIKGVVVTHLTDKQFQELTGGNFVGRKNGGLFVRAELIPAMMEKHPLPGSVAAEEKAVYHVNEPEANRDIPLDLFPDTLDALSQDARGLDARPRRQAARTGDVQPAAPVSAHVLAVRQDPHFPGLYNLSSQLVEVGRRELPVSRVTNWQEAASALSVLGNWAVEHFDANKRRNRGRIV